MVWFSRRGTEFDGLSVRGVTIRISPGFFASEERRRIGQTFCGEKALKSRKPVVVVVRAIIGVAAVCGSLEFAGERGGPFFPGEMALLGEFHGESEGLGLPGLGKDRTTGIAGKLRQFGQDLRLAN